MAKSPATPSSDVFPTLYACTKLADNQKLYDIKFYPFGTDDDDQIFAVCGEFDVFILRPKLDADPPFEILRWWQNSNTEHMLNSLVWTKNPVTGNPWLCVAGAKPKQILILDVETDKLVRTLVGHGSSVNDLAISPLSENLLASASQDYTIRLWNLDPSYEKQPCVAIFAGEGHRQPVLVCHFHRNGRWMLTAGQDTAVCLWPVPSLQELERDPGDTDHPDPKVIYYPHFHSTEIHANYIDNAVFYGDLIFSRACLDQDWQKTKPKKDNQILLWKIDGFNSADDPPAEPPVPSPGVFTRSSFPHSERSRGFQRLLTFDMPYTTSFYERFGLLHTIGMRPILAMGNESTQFLFWDLQKLEEGYDPSDERPKKAKGRKAGPKAKRAAVEQGEAVNKGNLDRLGELRREQSSGDASPDPTSTSASATPERKYDLSDPFMPLKAHYSIVITKSSLSPRNNFPTRQIAWSPNGKWMIGVGDLGMMCMFHREASVA